MVRNHRLTVMRLGSGWAAVLLAEYNDGDELGWFTDIADTGIGRYETRAEALREAKSRSQEEEIPLEKGLES